VIIDGEYPPSHYHLGVVYANLGRDEDAIEQFLQVIALRPSYAEAHNNLGVLSGKLGRYDDAIRHSRRALELEPDYPLARFNLGVSLLRQGFLTEALESQRLLQSSDPALAARLMGEIEKASRPTSTPGR
jgi:tetratricopeptide (TPR) repeat protein